MPDSPTSEPDSAFVCDCNEWFRSACEGEHFYKEHEGKRYCVLHFPGKEKSTEFEAARKTKIENKDFDFVGAWFPDEVSFAEVDFTTEARFHFATFSAFTSFASATFSEFASFDSATFSAAVDFQFATFRAKANFGSATFNAKANFHHVTFGADANFYDTTFREKANFRSATFSAEAYFHASTFSEPANFTSATFSAEASFSRAAFTEAFFNGATFSGNLDFSSANFDSYLDFRYAIFRDYIEFSGDESNEVFKPGSSLDLRFAQIQKPERVSFQTLTLHPHWFIDVDARNFDFVNVHWNNDGYAKPEIELLKSIDVFAPHRLLAVACRRLAANAEENDRYREASHFRRMAFDAERLETWRGFDVRRLNWWYWLASGYGERPFQALVVLVGMLLVFATLYTRVGFARWEPKVASESDVSIAKRDDVGAPLKFSRALTYSAGVMTLQKPEPRPATTAAQTVVLLETVLGPVQAALLALAIRRKFMR